MASGPFGFGQGNVGSRLVYDQRIASVGTFLNELANKSAEEAVIHLGYRFGENTRRLIKNFTGGNLLNQIGSNLKRY